MGSVSRDTRALLNMFPFLKLVLTGVNKYCINLITDALN